MTEGPATVGSLKSQGYKTVMAFCEAVDCSHSAPVPLDGLPDDLGVPDVAKRLRCAACGSKRIKTMLNMHEVYAKQWGGKGYRGI